jgi:hypothetical protein
LCCCSRSLLLVLALQPEKLLHLSEREETSLNKESAERLGPVQLRVNPQHLIQLSLGQHALLNRETT